MNGKFGGQRPRPRVALLGTFKDNDVEHFKRMFPTIWPAQNITDLAELVDVRETDLTIIASGGSVPKVVEKGIGISYPIVKPINEKGRIY